MPTGTEGGIILVLISLGIYCVPFFICIAHGGGVTALLILMLLIGNAILMVSAPQITALAIAAVMWSAAAVIAAMAVFTSQLMQGLKPVLEVASRLQQRATER